MYYSPDLEYEKAEKIIDDMKNSNVERDKLILYYINCLNRLYEDSKKQNSEYQEIFDKMSKFITGRPSTIYG